MVAGVLGNISELFCVVLEMVKFVLMWLDDVTSDGAADVYMDIVVLLTNTGWTVLDVGCVLLL